MTIKELRDAISNIDENVRVMVSPPGGARGGLDIKGIELVPFSVAAHIAPSVYQIKPDGDAIQFAVIHI